MLGLCLFKPHGQRDNKLIQINNDIVDLIELLCRSKQLTFSICPNQHKTDSYLPIQSIFLLVFLGLPMISSMMHGMGGMFLLEVREGA